jgi:hypothetical protein
MPTIGGRRTTNAAAYNYQAAQSLLGLAVKQEDGSFYWALASIVFSAFTYEAFLNVHGLKILGAKRWTSIDRAGWRRKHSEIYDKLSLAVDFESQPGSTLRELFEFRNARAHGREEELVLDGLFIADLKPLTISAATSAAWEKKCTADYAAIALQDVRQAAMAIRQAAHMPLYGNNPFGIPSHGMFGAA